MQQEEKLQAATSMKSLFFFSFCEVHVVNQNKIISEVAFRANISDAEKSKAILNLNPVNQDNGNTSVLLMGKVISYDKPLKTQL